MQPDRSWTPCIRCTIDMSPVDWVIDHPQSVAVFESLGIDYSCAGKSLEYLCRQQGLDPRSVVAQIAEAVGSGDTNASE